MPSKKPVRIWAGTRKGAFVFSSKDRKKWDAHGPFFGGQEVHHVTQDPRDPKRLYAAVGNAWFGPHLHASTDGGKTWQISEKGLEAKGITGKTWQVTEKGMELKDLPDATLKRIWQIAPGAADEPGVVYLGGDPGVLFHSGDNGANWEMVPGLNNHATRAKWTPGAGGMMVHSIECLGKGRLIVGISAAGAFRSSDSGKNWEAFNGNVRCDFAPDKYPEVGQCVHKLKAHPRNSEALYQQNHCGIYRASFTSDKWTDISSGLPSRFGFALAVPAAEKQTLFTIPVGSAEARFVPEGKLRVGRSRDGGRSWKLLTKGLPQSNAFVLVLREGMTSDDRDPAGVYFGTSSGSLFYTRDVGDSWQVLTPHLPPVYSVSAALH
ncbi:MAG: WD40/YVTN/BNR-like repeat-containing protein [Candidatus Acidiferrales bacterium]